DQQPKIVSQLSAESHSSSPEHAAGASAALHYLNKPSLSSKAPPEFISVDETLAKVARDQDQFLRELTAFAFIFWDGPQAEATLLLLSRDRGQGTLVRVPE